MYYQDKITLLQRMFGSSDIQIGESFLRVGQTNYPVIDDVIILLDPSQYPQSVRERLPGSAPAAAALPDFAEQIQYSFGSEWKEYTAILPEHRAEFDSYFDLVDLPKLQSATVCDLGCGNGRWSYFVQDRCRELILVDFSEAIFVAKKNITNPRAVFFMGDITRLPFADNFADFIFCLGVLHHLPVPCLTVVRQLKKYAPELLIYLYYALDNRPWYFRYLFSVVDRARRVICCIRNERGRAAISFMGALTVYWPLVAVGHMAQALLRQGRLVPLYEAYHGKSFRRIEQDVYDRFFTSIEQRVSRQQIQTLTDTFGEVKVSEALPYWHFLCRR